MHAEPVAIICQHCTEPIRALLDQWHDSTGAVVCVDSPTAKHEPEVFRVTDRVYWSDPDGGTCSAYGTITHSHGNNTFTITTDAGSEAGAFASELSRAFDKPHCWRFDLGNSTTGQIGACVRTNAKSAGEALALVRDALPEGEDIEVNDTYEDGRRVEARIYFNTDALTLADCEDEGEAELDEDHEEE